MRFLGRLMKRIKKHINVSYRPSERLPGKNTCRKYLCELKNEVVKKKSKEKVETNFWGKHDHALVNINYTNNNKGTG